MLHTFEGQVLPFLTTPDGQCNCLKEFTVFWLSKPTKVKLEPEQSFAGMILVLGPCRHKIGSFRIVFVVIMELKGFSTHWNCWDAHITARFCTDFSFNSLRKIWFVLKLTCKMIVVFPWIDATHFRTTIFFSIFDNTWQPMKLSQRAQCYLIK